VEQAGDQSFLSLSAASKLLGVHSSTLRRWADSGAVPVYITPGGHRRFARSDIEALAQRKPQLGQTVGSVWMSKALTQTRNDLAQPGNPPAWMLRISEDERQAWRRIGQQLMGVVLRYINSNDPAEDEELLDEAATIGQAYAYAARRHNMPLTAALEAALFFRDSLVEAAMDLPDQAHMHHEASARLLRRISRIANIVQIAVAKGFEEAAS
jgi:excisionase family DNA binding protein